MRNRTHSVAAAFAQTVTISVCQCNLLTLCRKNIPQNTEDIYIRQSIPVNRQKPPRLRSRIHNQKQLGVCLSTVTGACPNRVILVNTQEQISLCIGIALIASGISRRFGNWRFCGMNCLLRGGTLPLHTPDRDTNSSKRRYHTDNGTNPPNLVAPWNLSPRHLYTSLYRVPSNTIHTFFAYCKHFFCVLRISFYGEASGDIAVCTIYFRQSL